MIWTQEESIEFECTRELITDLRAILNAQLYRLESQAHPEPTALGKIQSVLDILWRERADLHIDSQHKIERINAAYGPFVRSWRAADKLEQPQIAQTFVDAYGAGAL